MFSVPPPIISCAPTLDPAYQSFLASLDAPPEGPTMDDVLAELDAKASAAGRLLVALITKHNKAIANRSF